MSEKDAQYNTYRKDTDWLQLLQEAIKAAPDQGMHGVPKLSDKEIKAEGQEKPKKPTYPSTSQREIEIRLLHLEYIRQNYDPRTGQKLDTWMEESDWIQKNFK
jgi:hypothetical protein